MFSVPVDAGLAVFPLQCTVPTPIELVGAAAAAVGNAVEISWERGLRD